MIAPRVIVLKNSVIRVDHNSGDRRRGDLPTIYTDFSGVAASAERGARLSGNMVGPCDQGDASGRGQSVKSMLDPLEPTIDVALKDFGGVWSKYSKVSRTTWRAGKRVGHG